MSEPRTAPDASMEEILASIRRIISEEGPPPSPATTLSPSEQPAVEQGIPGSVADVPAEISPVAPPEPVAMPAGDATLPSEATDTAANRSEEAALVLTQVVAEGTSEGSQDELLLTDALPPPAPAASASVIPLLRQKGQAAFAAPQASPQSSNMPRPVDRDRQNDGSLSLEDFVRQSLEPKIQEWLHANLEDMVERLVQEEIQRISRRAE
jgi:uncharacterized protein